MSEETVLASPLLVPYVFPIRRPSIEPGVALSGRASEKSGHSIDRIAQILTWGITRCTGYSTRHAWPEGKSLYPSCRMRLQYSHASPQPDLNAIHPLYHAWHANQHLPLPMPSPPIRPCLAAPSALPVTRAPGHAIPPDILARRDRPVVPVTIRRLGTWGAAEQVGQREGEGE